MPYQQPFRFLDLPSEIRRIVYGYYIHRPYRREYPDPLGLAKLFEFNENHDTGHSNVSVHGRTAILLVSRQVHDEASDELYGRSIFGFSDDAYDMCHAEFQHDGNEAVLFPCSLIGLLPFLRMIGKFNRLKLRELILTFSTEVFFEHDYEQNDVRYLLGDALELLSEAHNLQKLVLDLNLLAPECFRGLIYDMRHGPPGINKLADQFGALRGVRVVNVIQNYDIIADTHEIEDLMEDGSDKAAQYYSNHAQTPRSPKGISAQSCKLQETEPTKKPKHSTALDMLRKEEEEILRKLREVRHRIAKVEDESKNIN